jgi:hypothetical protein
LGHHRFAKPLPLSTHDDGIRCRVDNPSGPRSVERERCPLWVKSRHCAAKGHVCFTPESGHVARWPRVLSSLNRFDQSRALVSRGDFCSLWIKSRHSRSKKPCPLYAESGHMQCSSPCLLWANIGPTSDEHSDAWQDNPDLGELVRLRIIEVQRTWPTARNHARARPCRDWGNCRRTRERP